MTTMSKITASERLNSGQETPQRRNLRRWLPVAGAAFAAATTLAACGGGSSSNQSSSGDGGGGSGAQGGGKAVVSLQKANGVGMTLVDSSGKTLYFSDEEKSGKIACTDSCLGFWFPLTVGDKTVAQPDGLSGKLGTVKRSDNGKLQVTYNGAPLYTFKLDTSAGDTKGNNFSDDFGGTHFTWHAAGAKGADTKQSSPPKDNGGYGDY